MEDGPNIAPFQDHTEPVRYAQTTWRALAALTTEHQHALRHALDRNQVVESVGEVYQQHETTDGFADSTRSPRTSDQSGLHEAAQARACSENADDSAFANSVRMETERISAKVRVLNPARDVVVRVEFIRGKASRVCAFGNVCCGASCFLILDLPSFAVQVIAMAIVMGMLIGATVLLAEFIKKLQLVRSQSGFVPACHAV